jgi:hypothetical protein
MKQLTAARDSLAAGQKPELAPLCSPDHASDETSRCCTETAAFWGAPWATTPDNATSAAVANFILLGPGGYAASECQPSGVRPGGGYAKWANVLREGRGTGADMLRLAVARQMEGQLEVLSKDVSREADLPAFFRAVAQAVPGTCQVYERLSRPSAEQGADKQPEPSVPYSIEHSACVHDDLKLRSGPGPQYGSGLPPEQSVWRAAMGALLALRQTVVDLRLGVKLADPKVKAKLEAQLPAIEAGSAKANVKRVASAPPVDFAAIHASAGVPFYPPTGATASVASTQPPTRPGISGTQAPKPHP